MPSEDGAESGQATKQERGRGVDYLDERNPLAYVFDGETLLAVLYDRRIVESTVGNEDAVSNAFGTASMDVSLTPRGEEVLEDDA